MKFSSPEPSTAVCSSAINILNAENASKAFCRLLFHAHAGVIIANLSYPSIVELRRIIHFLDSVEAKAMMKFNLGPYYGPRLKSQK